MDSRSAEAVLKRDVGVDWISVCQTNLFWQIQRRERVEGEDKERRREGGRRLRGREKEGGRTKT